MKVSDFANNIVITVSLDSSLKEVIDVLSRNPSGRVVVLKDEKPVGIISTRDVVAAFSEYAFNVYELKAKDISSETLVTISPNDDVDYVIRLMLSNNIGGVPIVENNTLVGIFTEREVLKLINAKVFSGLVDSIMSTKVVTVDEESNIIDAAKLMTKSGVRRLPVIKDDKLIGIVTAADIVKFIAKSNVVGKVLDAGTRNPITISRYDQISKAAKIMMEKRIGTLPVLDQKLVGIVTERDLMYAYINA